MNPIPESQFGLRDLAAIFLSVILFFLFRALIPEQRWITDSEEWLVVTDLIISGVLSVIAWLALQYWLIPSNEELIDLDVKRQVAGGLNEIKEDAIEIQSFGNKVSDEYADRVTA